MPPRYAPGPTNPSAANAVPRPADQALRLRSTEEARYRVTAEAFNAQWTAATRRASLGRQGCRG